MNELCGDCFRVVDGKNQVAITFYEKAKEVAQQVGDKYQEYRTDIAIGNILCDNGNHEKAKECYNEALKISEDVSDKHLEGKSYLHLASACIKECNYETAKEWYEMAWQFLK